MWQQFRLWQHYHLAKLHRWYQNPTQLSLAQQHKILQLLSYIKRYVPFYQQYSGVSFGHLPRIDKTQVQENFAQFNVLACSLEEVMNSQSLPALQVHQSCGTTGKPGVYLFSHKEMIVMIADLLSKLLLPHQWRAQKVAIFYHSKTAYIPNMALWGWQWCFLDLHQDFALLSKKLQQFSPDVVIAPAQTLVKLAELKTQQKFKLNVKKIVSTAEVLTPLDEKFIACAFEQNIHQLYQCAEGWLGVTCDHGFLHLNENLYYIEKDWMDEKNKRFVPVITALHRYVQPIVRYRMEDVMVMKSECTCGSPLLAVEKIVGRCEDILYFNQRSHHPILKPIFSDELCRAIEQSKGGMQKYQIIQLSPMHLEIKIQAAQFEAAARGVEQQLERLWAKHGVKAPCLRVQRLPEVALDQMFRRTQRVVGSN